MSAIKPKFLLLLALFCSFVILSSAAKKNRGPRGRPDMADSPAQTHLIANMEKQLEQARKEGDEKKVQVSYMDNLLFVMYDNSLYMIEKRLNNMRDEPRHRRHPRAPREEL